MESKVLIASDVLANIAEDEVFHCLAELGNVWHVKLDDLLETYEETVDDGWDIVVIDSDGQGAVLEYVNRIREINPEQLLMVTTNYKGKMYALVMTSDHTLCVSRCQEAIEETLERLGIGGGV